MICGCERKPSVLPSRSFRNSVGMEMVALDNNYYVSKYETRQSEFFAIMDYNPSDFLGENRPVESVTWDQAMEFCRRLTQRDLGHKILPPGFVYSLPTRKKWRAFIADASVDSAIIPHETANNIADGSHSTMPVGSGDVNRLGLYDLVGNVSEWSADIDPDTGVPYHLGASWNTYQTDRQHAESELRFRSRTDQSAMVGFRCVLVPTSKSP